MSQVFISYSHLDKEYADSLHRHLLDQGFDAWIDDRIDYGSHWPREIEKRLKGCAAFILLMSPDAYESEWVQNELSFAQQLKKPVFPLLLRGNVWWYLQTTQFIDVRDGKLPPARFFIRLAEFAPRARDHGDSTKEPITPVMTGTLEEPVVERSEVASDMPESRQEKSGAAPQPKIEVTRVFPLHKPTTAAVIGLIGIVGAISVALISLPQVANLFSRPPEPTQVISPTETKTPAPSDTPTRVIPPTQTNTSAPNILDYEIAIPIDLNASGAVNDSGEVYYQEGWIWVTDTGEDKGFVCVRLSDLPSNAVIQNASYSNSTQLSWSGVLMDSPDSAILRIESVDIGEGLDSSDFSLTRYGEVLFDDTFAQFMDIGWQGINHSQNLQLAVQNRLEYYCIRFWLREGSGSGGQVDIQNMENSDLSVDYKVP